MEWRVASVIMQEYKEDNRPFRVLSLDGGGMRGSYTATYLACLSEAFARRRNAESIDIGKAFDLIVGTSTGGIIACALAADIPMRDIINLYRNHGAKIFSLSMPDGINLKLLKERKRSEHLKKGNEELRSALTQQFGDKKLVDIYKTRKIALAITAVDMGHHRSWVFKTPHLKNSMGRDNEYSLVDVCLATSAAPIYRSMAPINRPDGIGNNVFVDGGLWANNPILVGMVDALEMTEPKQEIHLFSIGTCPRPSGEQIAAADVHRGLGDWKFGGLAASLSIDAQEFAYDNIAKMLAKHVDRDFKICRFPSEKVPVSLMPYLELDDTREEAINALINQARTDADMTNSRCNDPNSHEGNLINQLFADAPAINKTK